LLAELASVSEFAELASETTLIELLVELATIAGLVELVLTTGFVEPASLAGLEELTPEVGTVGIGIVLNISNYIIRDEVPNKPNCFCVK
jgi:hypothetical protein